MSLELGGGKPFPLERLLAIFEAIVDQELEAVSQTIDVQMQVRDGRHIARGLLEAQEALLRTELIKRALHICRPLPRTDHHARQSSSLAARFCCGQGARQCQVEVQSHQRHGRGIGRERRHEELEGLFVGPRGLKLAACMHVLELAMTAFRVSAAKFTAVLGALHAANVRHV